MKQHRRRTNLVVNEIENAEKEKEERRERKEKREEKGTNLGPLLLLLTNKKHNNL